VGIAGPSLGVVFVVAGVVVAVAHLFLDSLTEKGVYLLTKRTAIAHFGSGNVILNGIFLVGGFLLFVL
jgi:hypothetical protein